MKKQFICFIYTICILFSVSCTNENAIKTIQISPNSKQIPTPTISSGTSMSSPQTTINREPISCISTEEIQTPLATPSLNKTTPTVKKTAVKETARQTPTLSKPTLISPTPQKTPTPTAAKNEDLTILGSTNVNSTKLAEYVQQINSAFDPNIAIAFVTVSKKYAIRGDVAFCQSIHETDWFRFTKDVKKEQNNFGGIGATGGGVCGNSFSSIEEGVTAQIQHLYAYSTDKSLPAGETIVDPRYKYVKRNTITYWRELGGIWAIPGYDTQKYASLQLAVAAKDSYGYSILKLYEDLLKQ